VTAAVTRTAPPLHVLAGALLGVLGVAITTGAALSSLHTDGAALAVAASLAAALSYGVAGTYAKRTSARASPRETACGSMIAASAVLLVPAGLHAGALASIQPATWLVLALLGVACTGVAYLLYFRLIADEGPARALSVTLLVPLAAALWSGLFLHERIGLATVLGGALILSGTALTNGALRMRSAT
jgi:drug/metabolite transporter (DMT)-like permease